MPSALPLSRDSLARGVARVRGGFDAYNRNLGEAGPEIAVQPFDAANVSTPAALIKLGTSIAAARRKRANFDAARSQLALEKSAAAEKAALEGDKTRAEIAKLREEAAHPTIAAGDKIVPSGPYKGRTYADANLDIEVKRLNKPTGAAADPFEPMDDLTQRMAALNYAKGAGLPPLGNSKQSAKARMDIMRYAAHHFPALDVAANKADYAANTASLKNLQGSLDFANAYGSQLEKNSETIKSIVDKIPDTGAQWSNAIVRTVLPQIASGSNLPEYNAAVEFVGNEANRLLTASPATGSGQITDQGKKEIRAVISKNFTKRDMIGVLGILSRDKDNRVAAYGDQIERVRTRMAWNEFGAQPRLPQPGGADSTAPTQADLDYVKSLGIK